jgi:hypothetical protein
MTTEPTIADLPHARRFAVGFGPLLALACVIVFAAGALAQDESPSAGPRGEPSADARDSPTGVAAEGAAETASRAAVADPATLAAAQGRPAPLAAYDEALGQFLLPLLAILALRPIVVLLSAILRRRRERTD